MFFNVWRKTPQGGTYVCILSNTHIFVSRLRTKTIDATHADQFLCLVHTFEFYEECKISLKFNEKWPSMLYALAQVLLGLLELKVGGKSPDAVGNNR